MALKRKRSNSLASVPEISELPEYKKEEEELDNSLDNIDHEPENKEQEPPSRQIQLEAPEFTVKIKTTPRQTNGKRFKQKFEYDIDLKDKLDIQPAQWHELGDYVSFVQSGATFKKGEIIEVKRPGDDGIPGQRKEWIAKILEIKAIDPAHVYARIAWFYWPEDLPMGRQEYHGRNEAIESNHPGIIDALTVNGIADIKEWDEDDENASFDGYYYRQQFDYISKQLTNPIRVCVCQGHYNPDTRIMHCPGCKLWLHEECIIADAVKRHEKSSIISKLTDKPKPGPDVVRPAKKGKKVKGRYPSKKSVGGLGQTVAAVVFDGKLRIKEGIRKGDNDSDSGLDPDTIIDEEIRCLKCGEILP
ncbi:hypothetical protein TWF281_007331 [Arthrobotrys megalospora]